MAILCFLFGYISIGLILSLYPRMLREYLVFPSNIFESDLNTATTLIFDYLGLTTLIPQILVFFVGIFLIYFWKKEIIFNRYVKIIFLLIIIILTLFTAKQPSPQPLLYSIQMQIESIIKNEKRVVPTIKVDKRENHSLINPIKYPNSDSINYDHIIMVVLEGITANSFENEFLNFENGFYSKNIENSVYFENYFTNNLDSYTSLIAMTTGIFVPYRSYSDVDLYENVNFEKNLVDYFNKAGYNSLFVSTFEYQPFIPSKKFWRNIYLRKDFDVRNYVTIGSSRMEKATEDKSAIQKIANFVIDNKKTFIMHELAYGHSPEWRAKMGFSQLKYYNDYLIELSDKLTENKNFENTLLVVVSDHGDRAKIALMDNYRVPQLMVGNEIKKSKNQEFYSHLDLPEIIFSIVNNEPIPNERKEIFTVGSSEKWTYGLIKNSNEFVFINNAKGTILSKSKDISAKDLHNKFQIYVDEFNLRYGKK